MPSKERKWKRGRNGHIGMTNDVTVLLAVLGIAGQVLRGLQVLAGLLRLVGVRGPLAAIRSASWGLTLQTVGALGPKYDHPDWVSYLVRDHGAEWLHTMSLEVPANSVVRVTILQYDSATGLRNPFFARPQGTVGNVIQLDGKTVDVIDPSLTSHTFAIPQLGVSGSPQDSRLEVTSPWRRLGCSGLRREPS
jgi:hypothetical protein